MEGKLDLGLIGNGQLFLHLKSQSDLMVEVFQRLANEFPQSRLIKFHPQAKGTKVSKGYRLENCPYEVLDLCRDFDPESGFNIRILQWWGHGLYFFVQIGLEKIEHVLPKIREGKDFFFSPHLDPWDYGNVVEKKIKWSSAQNIPEIPKAHFFQIFKEIAVPEEAETLFEMLKREILLIIDNHQ